MSAETLWPYVCQYVKKNAGTTSFDLRVCAPNPVSGWTRVVVRENGAITFSVDFPNQLDACGASDEFWRHV